MLERDIIIIVVVVIVIITIIITLRCAKPVLQMSIAHMTVHDKHVTHYV